GGNTFSSKPPPSNGSKTAGASTSKSSSSPSDSGFNFDTAAARAQKEQASKSDYTRFKESKTPPVIPSDSRSAASRPSPSPDSRDRGWTTGTRRDRRTYAYVPDVMVIRT